MKRELVGHVLIDSGQVAIIDPCHVDDPTLTYDEFCVLGVCSSTGYGDGSYPVYAKMQDGRVARLIIEFF